MGTSPAVSIVMPLEDDRGELLDALRAWREQRFEGVVQLVLPSSHEVSGIEALAGRYLAPHDRLFVVRGARNERELFDAGVQAADADLVILAEAHCIPDPVFLAEMTAYLGSTGFRAAAPTSIPISGRPLEEFEAAEFERGQVYPWNHFVVHGFAIAPSLYFEAGGFTGNYGNFASPAFAARLHALGVEVGHATRAKLVHRYRGDLKDVAAHIREHAWGEMNYRLSHDRTFCEAYFGGPVLEWELRGSYERSSAARIVYALARAAVSHVLLAQFRRAVLSVRQLPHWLVVLAAGPGLQALPARARLAVLKLLLRAPGDQRKRNAYYRTFWDDTFHAARCNYGRRHPLQFARLEDEGAIHPAVIDASRLAGFWPPERWQDFSFRWSWPTAGLWLRRPKGSNVLRVLLLNIRDDVAQLEARWSGKRLELLSRTWSGHLTAVSFRLPPEGGDRPEFLGLLSNEWRRRRGDKDPRALGLPLYQLDFGSNI
jgi:hypothetical protein